MRGVLVLGLALGLASGAASADVKKSAVSKKRVVKTQNKRFNLIAANTQTTATDTADATVKAPVETVTQEATPSKWGLLIDVWNENKMSAINRANNDDNRDPKYTAQFGDTTGESYTLIRPSYRLQDDLSVALGLAAIHGWGTDTGNESRFSLDDPYLMLASSNLGTIGSVGTKGYVRLYLPFTEGSQDKGQIAMVRFNGAASIPLGAGLKLSGIIEPRYYAQSEDSYRKPGASGAPADSGAIANNQWGRARTWLQVSGSLGGGFSFYTNAGFGADYYYRNDDAVEKTEDISYYLNETMVYYGLTKNLELGVGVTEFRDAAEDYTFYDELSTNYVLEAVASF